MNIKSLLLGSAAALAVVSGAHAADAIVAAQPEPAEYVKVCDAYGTGYFYIPGTETCLKFGGKVRYDIKTGAEYDANAEKSWSKRSRFELHVSTASDTEYGALKTSGNVQFNNDNNSDSLDIIEATVSLGGLTIGQTDSLFSTLNGYAGNVIQDGDIVGYGPFDTQLIQYTHDAGNGLTISAALEHDPVVAGSPDDNYIPNLVAGAAYSNDGFGIGGVVGYDRDAQSAVLKARLDGKFGIVSAFLIGEYNTDSTSAIPNVYAVFGGDWAVIGGFTVNATDKLQFNTQVGYSDAEDFEVAADMTYTLVDGFAITPEVDYVRPGAGDDRWGGILRFDRSF
nr:porin [uncultured Gellertiella sp.]